MPRGSDSLTGMHPMAGTRRAMRRGERVRSSPQRVARTELEASAMKLRREGHSFDEIKEIMGLPNEETAYRLVVQGLERKGKPEANDLRSEMLDRLDILANRSIRIARSDAPDRVSAINAAVNVFARMSAIAGTDAPKQVDLKDDRMQPTDPAARKKFVERLAAEALAQQSGGSGESS